MRNEMSRKSTVVTISIVLALSFAGAVSLLGDDNSAAPSQLLPLNDNTALPYMAVYRWAKEAWFTGCMTVMQSGSIDPEYGVKISCR